MTNNRRCLLAFFVAGLAWTTGASAQTAGAGEIRILSPGVTNAGMKALAESFTRETGIAVTIQGGTVTKIRNALSTDAPADLIILPTADLDGFAKSGIVDPGSEKSLGRIGFGLVVRSGAPHPDISTPEKFRAVLLASQSVSYLDPASGSLGGAIVADILARPEFAGVKAAPGRGARMVADGTAEIALQSVSEILPLKGVDFVGYVPDRLNAWMVFSAAVLAKSADQKAAKAFLAYITRPEASAIWKSNGVER